MKKLLLPAILFIQIFACHVFASCAHLKQLIGSWKFDVDGVSYHMNIDASGKVTGHGIRVAPSLGYNDVAYTLSEKYGMVYDSKYDRNGVCQLTIYAKGNKHYGDDYEFMFDDKSMHFNKDNIVPMYGFVSSAPGFYGTVTFIKY